MTITRPDISYAVNQATQFLHSPTDQQFTLVKRILRYVKGTINHGLHFSMPTKPMLIGYSDADWARCIETRHSTYGYSIFLEEILCLGVIKNNLLSLDPVVNLSIGLWQILLRNSSRLLICYAI